jgi:hypothetical protein
MLNSIGNSQTYTTMMTLFPLRENGYKFRVSSVPSLNLLENVAN